MMQTNATQLRNPADNPTTKTYYYHRDNDDCNPATTNARMRIYENLLHERIGCQEGAASIGRTNERSGDEPDNPQIYENVTRMENDERISPRIYENLLFERREGDEEEVIYENVAHLRISNADAILEGLPCGESSSDVMEGKQMKSSSDSLTPEGSLVWLSDSWKYNTIKKAPEFNIFEFPEIDSLSERSDEESKQKNTENEERRKAVGEGGDRSTRKKITNGNEKGDSARKMEMAMEKGKKKIRSKLPLFRWKGDKHGNEKEINNDKETKKNKGETKGKVETVIKPTPTSDRVLKTDNKRERNTPGVPDSPVSIHRRKIQKYSTSNTAVVPENSFEGIKKNAGLCQGERGEKEEEKLGEGKRREGRQGGVGGVSTNAAGGQIRFGTKRIDKPDQDEVERTSRSSVKSGYIRKPDKFDRGRQRREDSGDGEREGEIEGRGKGGNTSWDAAQSCGSTLISPGQEHSSSPPSSLLGAHRTIPRGRGGRRMALPSPSSASITSNSSSSSSSSSSYSSFASPRPSHPPPPPPVPHPSPNPSRGKASHKTRRRNLPMDSTPFPITSSSSSSASSSRSSSLTNISSSSSMEYEMQCIGSDTSKGRKIHHRVVPHSPKYERLEGGGKEDMARKTSQASSNEVPHPRLRDSKRHSPTDEDTPCQQKLPDLQKSKKDRSFVEKSNSGSRLKSPVSRTTGMPPVESYVTNGRKNFKDTEKENTEDERQNHKREIKERKSSRSSVSPYSTIPKKRKGATWGSDNDGVADNIEVEGKDRKRERDAAPFTSTDRQHPISQPEFSKESRTLPTSERASGRTSRPTSRRALMELANAGCNVPRNASPVGLPSPSPSCPPPIDEALQVAAPPYQYHSLPQLNVASDDYVRLARPSERDTGAPYRPYYMGDLYRAPIPGLSRSRRYSQTSLIDQALENLELSSLTGSESHLSNSGKRLSALSFEGQEQENFEKANSTRPTGNVRSPILPPLPAGVLDCKRSSPELNIKTESSPPDENTNLASVCILSFDLTLDCEEFSTNGFEMVNIANKTNDDDNKEENGYETEERVSEFDQEEIIHEDIQEGECEDEDVFSVCSSTLSIDEKYFDKDDYDNSEKNTCDFISESQQSQLEKSMPLFSNQDDKHKIKVTTEKNKEEEEEDFIEIDCDVKPMETLKRPLVYGYGNGPVRSLKGKSFLEKRLSSASDHSEYLELDMEAIYKEGTLEEVAKRSESCMNLRETYWDYWQAKRGMKGKIIHHSSCENSRNSSPSRQNCPSERFCYDPEVLLAHVRCPKSLEDATFKQYSAYVKSHIYDYFGNVQEALSEYGLSNAQRNWIHSQPDLLPNALNQHKNPENFEVDYSSEPELTHGSGREELYKMPPHLYSKRPPPPRPPPPPLQSRDSSQDSGTWTYLQSPQDPERRFSVGGVYPVPLPRSTSSLSHVGPITYNPWQHLLPNVTPPRTPRHSIYATNTSQVASRSASPSSRRSSITLSTNEATRLASASHQQEGPEVIPGMAMLNTAPKSSPGKKSFFPSLSKVVKSPLKRQNLSSKAPEKEDTVDVLTDLPGVHPSIQKRTHTTTSSKSSSSSSSSSSSASSKDSVTTVIPASARSKGPNWLMRHFGGARSKMTAV